MKISNPSRPGRITNMTTPSDSPESTAPGIRTLLHPPEFSEASLVAFADALKVALFSRVNLCHSERVLRHAPCRVRFSGFPSRLMQRRSWAENHPKSHTLVVTQASYYNVTACKS